MMPALSWEMAYRLHLQCPNNLRTSRAIAFGHSASKEVVTEGPLMCHDRCGEFFYCAAMEMVELGIVFRLCDQKATEPPATMDQYVL